MNSKNRREFFKSSVTNVSALTVFIASLKSFGAGTPKAQAQTATKKAKKAANKAAESAGDKPMDYDLIQKPKQGYISNLKLNKPDNAAAKKKLEKDKDKVAKTLGGKNPKGILPICQNCAQYRPAKDGYGKCAMVGAMGRTPTSYVAKEGWCKVWSVKASELKKMA